MHIINFQHSDVGHLIACMQMRARTPQSLPNASGSSITPDLIGCHEPHVHVYAHRTALPVVHPHLKEHPISTLRLAKIRIFLHMYEDIFTVIVRRNETILVV